MEKRYFVLALCLLAVSPLALAGTFVPGIAVSDAGKIADESKKEFFAYYITADSPIDSTSAAISKHLVEAAKVKANLAIFGPDYLLNTAILKAALAGQNGSLTGATILYVGGTDEVEELKAAALPTGATFRATTYSGK